MRIPVWIPLVFCTTGFAALLYQVVWQRVLYSTFGVNVEAVTTVVCADCHAFHHADGPGFLLLVAFVARW